MFMSLKTSNKYQLKKGDLVTLSEMWQNIGGERIRSQWSQPIVGIITEIVISAGMPAGKHYAHVLWDNNQHRKHYISDLKEITQEET